MVRQDLCSRRSIAYGCSFVERSLVGSFVPLLIQDTEIIPPSEDGILNVHVPSPTMVLGLERCNIDIEAEKQSFNATYFQ